MFELATWPEACCRAKLLLLVLLLQVLLPDCGFVDVDTSAEADDDEGTTTGPPDELFKSELIDSSLCHLEFRAEFICAHNSFLHDFDLKNKRQNVSN